MNRGLVLADIEHSSLVAPHAVAGGERFEQWVEAYQQRVSRLAQRLLGWRADVDDVVQDVFLAALNHAHKFRGEATPWTWLAAITINCCRERMRRKAFLRGLGLERWFGKARAAPAADCAVIDKEIHQRVRACVSALPQKEREVVVLFYLEDFSTVEIGKLLRISPNAAEVRLHRARKKMRAGLADVV